MNIIVYDGSFDGLLTAIYNIYYYPLKPQKITTSVNLQQSLLDDYYYMETDLEKARKVYLSIKKISPETLENAYCVYLSNSIDSGIIILEYIKLGFQVGARVNEMLADDRVLNVTKICQKVMLEKHRFCGFVRFRLLEGGIYYASIEPDNNIVELLAPHFADRFAMQKWMIHDTKRNLAAVYNLQDWYVTEFDFDGIPALDKEQLRYEELWKTFYDNIAIAARVNPKLQKGLMPKRYWKNILEKW